MNNFKIGEIVEFVKNDGWDNQVPPHAKEEGIHLPDGFISTGTIDYELGQKEARIIDIYEKVYLVEYTAKNKKKYTLGFTKDKLIKTQQLAKWADRRLRNLLT